MTESRGRYGPFITRQDVAEMLAVSPRTVSTLAKAGYLRVVRVGKSMRFDVADILLFIGMSKGEVNDEAGN